MYIVYFPATLEQTEQKKNRKDLYQNSKQKKKNRVKKKYQQFRSFSPIKYIQHGLCR